MKCNCCLRVIDEQPCPYCHWENSKDKDSVFHIFFGLLFILLIIFFFKVLILYF
jgi:RNA polymerase subunit RPABC4/transcription elongation factor Spt4